MKQSFRLGGGEFEYKPQVIVSPVDFSESDGQKLPRLVVQQKLPWLVVQQKSPRLVVQVEQASIQEGRRSFLTAAGQVEPVLLESLGQRPLEAFAKSVHPDLMIFDWRQVEVTRSFRELRTRVLEWSRRWNLTDPWCLEWIVQTLGWWHLRPFELQNKAWFHDDLTSQPYTAPPPEVKLRPWDPTSLTRSDYEAQVRSIIDRRMAIYCDEVEKAASATGLTPTPERRELEHFYWLSRYQIKGERPGEIAEGRDLGGCWSRTGSSSKEKKALARDRAAKIRSVKKAIARLAKFLCLTPRSKLEAEKDSKPSR